MFRSRYTNPNEDKKSTTNNVEMTRHHDTYTHACGTAQPVGRPYTLIRPLSVGKKSFLCTT